MNQDNKLNKLLFDSGMEDYDDEREVVHHREQDQDDLLEDDQMQSRDYLQQIAGRPSIQNNFRKVRGDTTERQFQQQNEYARKFPQVNSLSVEFSHSEFNQSSIGKDKSPVKPSLHSLEQEIRRRDAQIEYLKRQLEKKGKQDEEVNEVLGQELGDFQRQHQKLTSLVNERDSLIRGFKKKIEQLEAELEETKRDLVSRSEIELNLQRKLTLLENEYNSIADSSEEKDKVFAAMQKEINEAVNKIDELETTIETLKKQKKEMKEQIELYNLNERDIRTLNVERPNRQDEIVASKRSLTNIYDRNGTELKKQYSTKTLIDDTPTRHIEEMQRLRAELEDAKRQLQYYQDGFMDTKKQSEKLQQLTEEMQLVGANQSAEIHRLNNEVRRKEEYISELSKTLDREKRGARERQESELKSQYERRLRAQNQNLIQKEDKIKELLLQLTKKSKDVQDGERLIVDLRSRLEQETKKLGEAQKESKVQSGQLKEQREKIFSLEKLLEEGVKGKKQQDRIEQLKKDVVRLEKEAGERDTRLQEAKKKLEEATKKNSMSRTRITELEETLTAVKAQLAVEKESHKKMMLNLNEAKKKAAEAETLSNKLKILEAQMRSERQRSESNHKDSFDLNDRVDALEEILRAKDRQLDELKQVLEQMQQQLNQQQHHDQQPSQLHEQLERLHLELEEKDQQLQSFRREIEFRQKSLEFLHNKLLKVEREKLEMQAEAKIFQSNLYESIDSQYLSENDMDSYNTKLTLRRDKLQLFEQKLRSLEEVNRQLEQKNKQLQERLKQQISEKKKSTASLHQNKQSLPTNHSTEVIRESCSNKIEVLVLKNRVKELTEMLNRVYNESNSKKLPPESLSPDETVEFLLETMRRVNRSSEMIRLLSKSSEFIELIKHIDRRKDESSHTRRLYA